MEVARNGAVQQANSMEKADADRFVLSSATKSSSDRKHKWDSIYAYINLVHNKSLEMNSAKLHISHKFTMMPLRQMQTETVSYPFARATFPRNERTFRLQSE